MTNVEQGSRLPCSSRLRIGNYSDWRSEPAPKDAQAPGAELRTNAGLGYRD